MAKAEATTAGNNNDKGMSMAIALPFALIVAGIIGAIVATKGKR